ncbi:SPOR domain-containing protein [Shewanella mangrovisoli]|uniref:SPOR domain-containing protein n=1 Tax=Shewanella mangrovisoli TaxID=2864211 RepID=UPI0035B6D20B
MSNRDYANRRPQTGAKQRPIRATRARPAAKKAAPRRKLPIPLILFAFIAVGSFGYFLFSIKDTAKQEAPVEVKTEKPTKAKEPATILTPKVKEAERQAVVVTAPVEEKPVVEAPKKDPNALPPKPKEEWTYLDELENKNVEVDIPDVVSTRAPQQYQLQCASFRQESQANQMKAVIAFQGLEAQVRQIEGTSGTWYKVILGPYERRRDAERKRHTLQNAGINGCQLLAVPK